MEMESVHMQCLDVQYLMYTSSIARVICGCDAAVRGPIHTPLDIVLKVIKLAHSSFLPSFPLL